MTDTANIRLDHLDAYQHLQRAAEQAIEIIDREGKLEEADALTLLDAVEHVRSFTPSSNSPCPT